MVLLPYLKIRTCARALRPTWSQTEDAANWELSSSGAPRSLVTRYNVQIRSAGCDCLFARLFLPRAYIFQGGSASNFKALPLALSSLSGQVIARGSFYRAFNMSESVFQMLSLVKHWNASDVFTRAAGLSPALADKTGLFGPAAV